MAKLTCDYCGTSYAPRKSDQRFCSGTCRKAFHRMAEVRGAAVYRHLMAWRAKPRDMRELTFISRHVDQWHEEDRKRKEQAS